jgi:hypothetical protein
MDAPPFPLGCWSPLVALVLAGLHLRRSVSRVPVLAKRDTRGEGQQCDSCRLSDGKHAHRPRFATDSAGQALPGERDPLRCPCAGRG